MLATTAAIGNGGCAEGVWVDFFTAPGSDEQGFWF